MIRPFNLDFFCHTGPLARTVKDAALLQNVISGPHPSDITTSRPVDAAPDGKSIKGWKIAYSPDLGFSKLIRKCAATPKYRCSVTLGPP